jgi:hypothetical protein
VDKPAQHLPITVKKEERRRPVIPFPASHRGGLFLGWDPKLSCRASLETETYLFRVRAGFHAGSYDGQINRLHLSASA